MGTNMNQLIVINNTLAKLQEHLSSAAKELIPGIWFKDITPPVKCKDGAILSVQASSDHYSTPRENFGPYTEVEVWHVTGAGPNGVIEFDYSDDDPSAYVPIEQVVQFIDNHGGIAD